MKRDIGRHIFELPNGTGRGLAIVSSIVSKHDGFLLVRSETGIGTMFEVYLPSHSI